jgi:uncharacterized membrane protein YedE/YeeE
MAVAVMIAGLLIGFSTRIGGGCTRSWRLR